MRIVVSEFVSLDGVVQAPGGAEEDTSDGFRYGGWSMPYFDPVVMGSAINEFAERSETLLQGRRTYRVSLDAWPGRSGPFADWINRVPKYVVSNTLTAADVASWKPTMIIRSDNLLKEVSALRKRPGGDVYVYGSLTLVRILLSAELVDELVLMIEPISLGGGKTLFPSDGQVRRFELTSATTTSTGVQLCRYRPIPDKG
jgi:dihydrofolate reductase